MIVDDLPTWGRERFLDAIREHRRSSNFIPTTQDLIKADSAAVAQLPELVALPPAPRDKAAEAATAKAWLDKIRSIPGFGGIRPEHAEPSPDKWQ